MCAPCKHKQAMAARRAMQNSPSFALSQVRTLENVDFFEFYYIGPSDEVIPSVIPNVSYGIKPYGSFMFVASKDYELHPEWWVKNEPVNNDSTN